MGSTGMLGAAAGSGNQTLGLCVHAASNSVSISGISLRFGNLVFGIFSDLLDLCLAPLFFLTRLHDKRGPGIRQLRRLAIPLGLPQHAFSPFAIVKTAAITAVVQPCSAPH